MTLEVVAWRARPCVVRSAEARDAAATSGAGRGRSAPAAAPAGPAFRVLKSVIMWHRRDNKYQCFVRGTGTRGYIGQRVTEQEAASAADAAAFVLSCGT